MPISDNAYKPLNNARTVFIASDANVTQRFDLGQHRYEYDDSGTIYPFTSADKVPATGDAIILSQESSVLSYLMNATDLGQSLIVRA